MRSVHPIPKEHRPNSVWRENFLRAKQEGTLSGVWCDAFSNGQPVVEPGKDKAWHAISAVEWAIREEETATVLPLLRGTTEEAYDLLPVAIKYHDHEAIRWSLNHISPLNWRVWSASSTQQPKLTTWGEAMTQALPTDAKTAEETMSLCWGHFAKDPKFASLGFLHTELLVSLLKEDQLIMAKSLLHKAAVVLEIQSTMEAAFQNRCAWFFEEASSVLQSNQPHRWGKWVRNGGQRWFSEAMPELWLVVFSHYKGQTAWQRDHMARYKSFWKTASAWAVEQKMTWSVEKAAADFFKERHGLYFHYGWEKRKPAATKAGRPHEAWFAKVWEENLLPQIKLPKKEQDVMAFWSKAGLTLDDSEAGKKTRALLERDLLLTRHKTVLATANHQDTNFAL